MDGSHFHCRQQSVVLTYDACRALYRQHNGEKRKAMDDPGLSGVTCRKCPYGAEHVKPGGLRLPAVPAPVPHGSAQGPAVRKRCPVCKGKMPKGRHNTCSPACAQASKGVTEALGRLPRKR